MLTLRPVTIRPNVRVQVKKNNFISSSDAPGEGNKRFPSIDQGFEEPEEKINPIKKFLIDVFKLITKSSVRITSGQLNRKKIKIKNKMIY